MLKRNFRKPLMQWKDYPLRTPLLVRGARQVGKTHAVESFGREEFKSCVTINFETAPEYRSCFEIRDPRSVIHQIELLSRKKITPGETLLFFDEIQDCPKALHSLRFFKEEMPELHLIAAGSLLEFAIRDQDFSFPVGRVQFARLHPLSFEEYLESCGDDALKETLYSFSATCPPSLALHDCLMRRVREYFMIGGMPDAVSTFLKTQSLLEVKHVQQALFEGFASDFGKYATKSQYGHLKKIFEEVPRSLGNRVKYSKIAPPEISNPAREMKQAMELLRLAGLLHFISATSAVSLPLLSGLRETIFKCLFLDIGLVNIDPQSTHLFTRPLAVQFVGQEFLASSDPFLDSRHFFWSREKGSAEVDFLLTHRGVVYPIEVEEGKVGKLKSLHFFIEKKNIPFGIQISQAPLGCQNRVLSVPFYLTSHLPRLIDSFQNLK